MSNIHVVLGPCKFEVTVVGNIY